MTRGEEGFRYDAFSYADRDPDSTWVWETLIPRLEREGLRVVVSGSSRDPGVPLVVNSERGFSKPSGRWSYCLRRTLTTTWQISRTWRRSPLVSKKALTASCP